MPKILIVGGGYAGFYTAWKLEKWLRNGEAEVTIVDPLPYWTYQPFLPEVAAGSIEPRHAVVPIREHLPKTRVLAARVTNIDHAAKTSFPVLFIEMSPLRGAAPASSPLVLLNELLSFKHTGSPPTVTVELPSVRSDAIPVLG